VAPASLRPPAAPVVSLVGGGSGTGATGTGAGDPRTGSWPRAVSWTAPTVAFGALMAVYAPTLLPHVGWSGDTAKFQFIGRVLGTPHHTGYPAYVLLNAAFVRLAAVGSLAWRANLLSALCVAAAGAVLVRVLGLLGVRPLVAVAGAVALGLTLPLWTQAVVAEVYGLQLLLGLLTLLFLLRWRDERRTGFLVAAAATIGVSLGNHLMTLLLVPGALVFVWLVDRRALRLRTVAAWGLVAGLGLLQYGFVVWRSYHPSATTYVQSRARDLGELVKVLRGADFENHMFAFPLAEVLDRQVPVVWDLLWRDASWLLLASAVGLVWRRRDPLTALLASWSALHVVWVLNYDVVDAEVFLIPAELCLVVWAALGLEAGCRWLEARRLRPVTAAVLVVPVAFGVWNYATVDRSKNTPTAARAARVVDHAPDGAVLVAHNYRASMYLRYHLLGEGLGEERDLVLADHRQRLRHLADYAAGRRDLVVDDRRVGPGRPLYTSWTSIVERAGLVGLRAELDGPRVWRLVPADRT
jgi:hypothetical protein